MRLLLVTHRPIAGAGGSVARWRALVPRLRDAGWEIDVVSAESEATPREFDPAEARRLTRRARLMGGLRRVSGPLFLAAGVTPAATPTSMAWILPGARRVRRALDAKSYDIVLATGPPMVGLLALRVGARRSRVPLVYELRDLWAGNPAYDRRGGLLGRLESRLFAEADAIVVVTPEARADLVSRHPDLAERVAEIPNGYEPELFERRSPARNGPRTMILHSGTLLPSRPLTPLLDVLAQPKHRDRFELVLHGYLSPESLQELASAAPEVHVEVVPPSTWSDAVERMRAADVCLVTQSRAAGDATAVAAKTYEYLALGRPVLCLSDGGATERLLHRLDAAELSARLSDPSSIDRALDRAAEGGLEPVVAARLTRYGRDAQAASMDELLRSVCSRRSGVT